MNAPAGARRAPAARRLHRGTAQVAGGLLLASCSAWCLAGSPAAWVSPASRQPGRLAPGGGRTRPRSQQPTKRFFFGDVFGGEEAPPDPEGSKLYEELPPPPSEGIDAPPLDYFTEEKVMEIVKYPHPALRRPNLQIEKFDEGPDGENPLRVLMNNMFETMYATGDGIGLAAPQVGVNLRLMVYNENAFQPPGPKRRQKETVFLNPVIVKKGGGVETDNESCLSFPGLRGPVKRPAWIDVEAQNLEGVKFTTRIEGYEARLFQHEYDHLDGILYVDRVEGQPKDALQGGLEGLTKEYLDNGGQMACP